MLQECCAALLRPLTIEDRVHRVHRTVGRRLLSRHQPVLDEDPRLYVPSRATALSPKQPAGLTILTGGVFYAGPGARKQLREWTTGRKHVDGGVQNNGSTAWVTGSDVEPA
jgi:hypothetical protein